MSFYNHILEPTCFSVLKGVTPTFSNLGTLLKIDLKNCPLLGKLLSVWKTVSVLPKSAQSANSAQTVENSPSFSNVSYTWYKSLLDICLQNEEKQGYIIIYSSVPWELWWPSKIGFFHGWLTEKKVKLKKLFSSHSMQLVLVS